MGKAPFWKTKHLSELSPEEWESLCDGCGRCCLEKLDDGTGEVREIAVSCPYLDLQTCRCEIYEARTTVNPQCIQLTPQNVTTIAWLPLTCAYRIVAHGGDLESWHRLVSGDPDAVHEAGISVRNKAVDGKFIHPDDIRRPGQNGRPLRGHRGKRRIKL